MSKKSAIVFIIIIMLTTFSLQAYTTGADIYDPALERTEQFMVKLFSPEFDSSTFNNLLLISGVAYEQDITVQLAVYNEATEYYEPLYTIEGENKWETDGAGLFFKELNLKEGVNKVRIVAYKTSMVYELVLGETLQISNFTITVVSDDIKKSFFMNIMDILSKFY